MHQMQTFVLLLQVLLMAWCASLTACCACVPGLRSWMLGLWYASALPPRASSGRKQ
jgi:hypothetical protein